MGSADNQSARELISDIMQNLISERQGVITPALAQRSKFEQWLKWELISELFERGYRLDGLD